MEILIVMTILNTFAIGTTLFITMNNRKKQEKIVERVKLIGKNPLKARKTPFKI